MQKFKFIKLSKDESDTQGSSLKGKLKYGIKYNDLVDMFGIPTYLPKDSGDGKVNFEWVIEFENENGAKLMKIILLQIQEIFLKQKIG